MNPLSTLIQSFAVIALMISMTASAHDIGVTATPNFNLPITNIPGKSLIAVAVEYAPGAASSSHTHAKTAFIYGYVVSGAIESQVNNGQVKVYKAGESFYETPGSTHPVSRNASKTQPAKLLAIFVVDTDDKNLTTPIK